MKSLDYLRVAVRVFENVATALTYRCKIRSDDGDDGVKVLSVDFPAVSICLPPPL